MRLSKVLRQAVWALGFIALATPALAVSNQDPCTLLARHPEWAGALRATEARWGVRPAVILAVIDQESSFRPTARGAGADGAIPRHNFGYAQAAGQTWNWFRRAAGRPDADRTNFADSAWFIGWYFNETKRRSGLPLDNTIEHYRAYKLGHGAWSRGSAAGAPTARQVKARAENYERRLATCLPDESDAEVEEEVETPTASPG